MIDIGIDINTNTDAHVSINYWVSRFTGRSDNVKLQQCSDIVSDRL